MKTFKLAMILVVGVLFIACASPEGNFEPGNEQIAQANLTDQSLHNNSQPSVSAKEIQRKIIKTGNLSMQVESYAETRTQLDEAIDKYEAYLSSEREENSSYNLSNNLKIRVKSEEFESLMNEIATLALAIDHKQINTSDVTEKYLDIEARLKTKKAVEVRYIELLSRANTISDILEIEEKARVIREEIESAEGRLQYLQNQVSYSTIEVYIYQITEFSNENLREPSFFSQIGKSISDGWAILLSVIVIVFKFWPFLLGLAGLLYILKWKKSKIIIDQSEKNIDEIAEE